MISVIVTMLLLVTVDAQWMQTANTDPGRATSCNSIECPRYTVLQRFNGYELRRYEPSIWVATNTTSSIMQQEMASRMMFMKLFRFISGNNYGGMKIEMTAPVLTKMDVPSCPSCPTNQVMYFMLPAVHQRNPPYPMDPSVYLVPMPAMNVYVKYYGGWPTMFDKMMKVSDLQTELTRDSQSFIPSSFIIAGYDSPWKRSNRHNEVWLQAAVSSGRQIFVMS